MISLPYLPGGSRNKNDCFYKTNYYKSKNNMMKNSLLGLFLVASATVFAQPTVTEQFQKINTTAEAQKFIDANATLKPTIYNLSWGKDSSMLEKRLLKGKKGDIINVGYVTYKILEGSETVNYRASYIFLDGATLSNSE